jgi:hypothetical protein
LISAGGLIFQEPEKSVNDIWGMMAEMKIGDE